MTKSSSSALCSCSVTTRWVSFVPRPADNAYRFLIIFGSVLTTRPTRSVVQATLLGKQRWCFLAPRSVSDEGSIRIPGVGGDSPECSLARTRCTSGYVGWRQRWAWKNKSHYFVKDAFLYRFVTVSRRVPSSARQSHRI